MRLKYILFIAISATMFVACKDKTPAPKVVNSGLTNEELKLTGDKTVYGLACSGCTDSVIVLLPNDGSDPVRYDIIDATRNRQVIGRPAVGDWIGLVINKDDNKMADMVINLDQLKGTWCYKVLPKMKNFDKMSKRMQARITARLNDTTKQSFLTPREYGFTLSRHWTASAVGRTNQSMLTKDSPLIYPELKSYIAWHILNGKLVLTHGKININKTNNDITYTNLKNDTAEFVFMRRDTLALKVGNQVMGYYRKKPITR